MQMAGTSLWFTNRTKRTLRPLYPGLHHHARRYNVSTEACRDRSVLGLADPNASLMIVHSPASLPHQLSQVLSPSSLNDL